MGTIKQLEPAYVSFYVTLQQVKTTAEMLIQKAIGKKIVVKVEAENFENSLKILVHIDSISVSDKESANLLKSGFNEDEPYNNGEFVVSKIFDGFSGVEVEPLTGEDEEWGTYFVVQVPFSTNRKFINLSLNL